jgi:hypothetical protein
MRRAGNRIDPNAPSMPAAPRSSLFAISSRPWIGPAANRDLGGPRSRAIAKPPCSKIRCIPRQGYDHHQGLWVVELASVRRRRGRRSSRMRMHDRAESPAPLFHVEERPEDIIRGHSIPSWGCILVGTRVVPGSDHLRTGRFLRNGDKPNTFHRYGRPQVAEDLVPDLG